jgi:hypothetical protein
MCLRWSAGALRAFHPHMFSNLKMLAKPFLRTNHPRENQFPFLKFLLQSVMLCECLTCAAKLDLDQLVSTMLSSKISLGFSEIENEELSADCIRRKMHTFWPIFVKTHSSQMMEKVTEVRSCRAGFFL